MVDITVGDHTSAAKEQSVPERDAEYWYQKRDEADIAAQVAAKAVPERRARTGKDQSGAVEVRIDADGALTQVHLAMDWEKRLGTPEALAPAVIEAVTVAGCAAVAEFSENLSRIEEQEEPPRARPVAHWVSDGDESPTNPTADQLDFMYKIATTLNAISDSLERAEQAHRELNRGNASVRSRHGEVEVQVGPSGTLTSLLLDLNWVRQTHPTNIGRLITQTVNAAQQQTIVAAAEQQAIILQAMDALTPFQDPHALFQSFGL